MTFDMWFLIIGMSLITFMTRYLPLALVGYIQLTPRLIQTLKYVPIAVLTCMIIQNSMMQQGEVVWRLDNPHFMAAITAWITAMLYRNLWLTIGTGLFCYVLARATLSQ